MARIPEDGSHEARLRELERRLQQLERADRLGNTSFRAPGKWRYLDAQGRERMRVGEGGQDGNINLVYNEGGAPEAAVVVGVVYSVATGEVIGHGLLVQDSNTGTDMLQAWHGGTGGWTLQLRDPNGIRLVHIDENGQPIPRVPQMFVPGFAGPDAVLADGVKTLSEGYVIGTYTAGRMVVRYVVAGTVSARYRVVDQVTGTVLVGWQTFTTSGYGTHDLTLDRSLWAEPWSRRLVRVEGEVTSGTGTITLYTVACYVGSFA